MPAGAQHQYLTSPTCLLVHSTSTPYLGVYQLHHRPGVGARHHVPGYPPPRRGANPGHHLRGHDIEVVISWISCSGYQISPHLEGSVSTSRWGVASTTPPVGGAWDGVGHHMGIQGPPGHHAPPWWVTPSTHGSMASWYLPGGPPGWVQYGVPGHPTHAQNTRSWVSPHSYITSALSAGWGGTQI